uniref:TAXi_C domain-containing protein n=1 Tax=Heterorhabditis bacteriophora TaxID=37862 RepID=A0A1I7WN65_HETBA
MDSVQELWKADKISQIAPLQVSDCINNFVIPLPGVNFFFRNGGQIIRVDISSTASLSLNETFLLDMRDIEGGPFVARDLRFIGGDSTSDNFL